MVLPLIDFNCQNLRKFIYKLSEHATTVVEARSSSGKELEIEENEVAIPIPVPGQLVPIEEEVQELPDKLVGTQITFELAEEDCPPSYE